MYELLLVVRGEKLQHYEKIDCKITKNRTLFTLEKYVGVQTEEVGAMSRNLVPQPIKWSVLEELNVKDLVLVLAYDKDGKSYMFYPDTKACQGDIGKISCFEFEGEPGKMVEVPQVPGADRVVLAGIAGFPVPTIWPR